MKKLKINTGRNKYDYTEIMIFIFVFTSNISAIACFSEMESIQLLCKFVELILIMILGIQLLRLKLVQKEVLTIIILLSIFTIVLLESKTIVFILSILLYISSKDVDFKDVTNLIWKAYLLLIVFSFILYFFGISDGGISRTYSSIRAAKAYGFTNANSGGYFFMMLFLSKMATDAQKSIKRFHVSTKAIFNILLYIFSLFMCYNVFKCRTGFVTCVLAVVLLIFLKKIDFKKIFLKYLLCLVHPIVLIGTVILAEIYPTKIMIYLDRILTSRFFLNNYHLINNRLTFFGSDIDYSKYTLDSSYMSYLLQYGIVPSIIYVVVSALVILKAWKKRDGFIIAIELAFLAYGFMENGIFDMINNFSYLYLIIGNKMGYKSTNKEYSRYKGE